jgi:hypothetical protein
VAKNRGVKFGCRKSEVPEGFERYYQLWSKGEMLIRKAAQELGMKYTTFYRRCMEIKEKDENKCCKM